MEHRVDGLHGIRESECEGVGSRAHNDLEWSKVLVGQFLEGAHGVEVLGLHEGYISDFEVRWSRASSVSRSLITLAWWNFT